MLEYWCKYWLSNCKIYYDSNNMQCKSTDVSIDYLTENLLFVTASIFLMLCMLKLK